MPDRVAQHPPAQGKRHRQHVGSAKCGTGPQEAEILERIDVAQIKAKDRQIHHNRACELAIQFCRSSSHESVARGVVLHSPKQRSALCRRSDRRPPLGGPPIAQQRAVVERPGLVVQRHHRNLAQRVPAGTPRATDSDRTQMGAAAYRTGGTASRRSVGWSNRLFAGWLKSGSRFIP